MRAILAAALAILLCGCLELEEPVNDRHQQYKADGIEFVVDLTKHPNEDHVFRVDAWAKNRSGKTYGVTSICDEPWRLGVHRDGAPIQYQEPMARCAALGKGPYPTGQNLTFAYAWDGREWDHEKQRLVEARDGTYEVEIVFWYYPDGRVDGDGDDFCCAREIRETFPVKKT